MSAPAPVLFGPYRLEKVLGRGGMGEVYRAYDTVRDRVVALKRLSAHLAEDVDRNRFRRECRTLASLRSSHVVEVYDYGEIDGHLFLAMQVVEGTDLGKLLERGRLDPTRAVEILSQVAEALDAAHAHGVVHRDVKPSNVLIDADGNAFLADFGIARPFEQDATSLTGTGVEIGTLDYMAPERLLRQGIDSRSDVYALACVLFHSLTGKLPFPGNDPAGKLAAQLNDPPPSPSLFDRRIPLAMDLIVATGMEKDPRRRYSTAGELMSAAAAAGRSDAPRGGTVPTIPDFTTDPGQGVLMRAIISVAARQQPLSAPGEEAVDCPYPGLRSFEAGDSGKFFGREQAVTDALVALSRQSASTGPLVVVGASGSGKSSLLGAGVLPTLDSTGARWPQVITTPGHDPIGTLAARLAPLARADAGELAHRLRSRPTEFGKLCRHIAQQHGGAHSRLVLAVDQFEELFTGQAGQEHAQAFAAVLANAWPALVVIAVRADFLEPCFRLEPLMPSLASPFMLGPLTVSELSRVITEPARLAGVRIEDGLTDRLITDLGARDNTSYDPGALPRLAHALRETWHHSSGSELTLTAYQATGGIDRAVALTADGVYNRLDDHDKYLLRLALLRMVAPLDGGRVARRTAHRDDIAHHVLQQLVDARLVTAEADGVRLSHDALLTAWPRLHQWIEQDRQGLVIRQQLGQAVLAWQASGGDRGELYRGARLAAVLDWARGRNDLSHSEHRFLRESKRAQQRETRKLRSLVTGLAVFLVIALVAGAVAVIAGVKAVEATHVAESRQLATESLAAAEFDPVSAQRKALQAWHASPTPQARGAILSAAARDAPDTLDSGLPDGQVTDVSEDGRLVAVGSTHGGIEVLDVRTGAPIDAAFPRGSEPVVDVEFSPDGRRLATATSGTEGLNIWDLPSGRLVRSLPAHRSLAWSSDGSRIVAIDASIPGKTAVSAWDSHTGAALGPITPPTVADPRSWPLNVAYNPDGTRLAVATNDGVVELWDTVSHTLVNRDTTHRDTAPKGMSSSADVAMSEDVLATASPANDAIRLLNPGTGTKIDTITDPYFTRAHGRNPDLSFTADGNHLVSPDRDTGAVLWNVRTRQRVGGFAKGPTRTDGQRTAIKAVATSGTGDTVGVQGDGTVVRWSSNPNWFSEPTTPLLDVTFVPGQDRVSATDRLGTHTWNPRTGTPTGPATRVKRPFDVDYTPDGTQITGQFHGRITVTDPAGQKIRTVELPRPNIYRGDIAVSPDGSTIAILTEQHTPTDFQTDIRIFDAESWRERTVLDLGRTTASRLAFAPDSEALAVMTSSARDQSRPSSGAVRTWRLSDLTEQPSIPTGQTGNLAYTPDGESLVLAAGSGVQVRDAETGEMRRQFGEHPSDIEALAIAPNGDTLATSTTTDSAIRLWDLATGQLLATLNGHHDYVTDLTFSPDGRTLASASADTDVGLWPVMPADGVRRVCDDLSAAGQEGLSDLGC